MKITEIILENFRGFKQLHLQFQEKNVVLVGTNGVGKSTILNAAIILLSRFVESLSFGISKKISLSETDIKNGKQGLKIKCTLEYNGKERQLELIKTLAANQYSSSKLTVNDSTQDLIAYLHKQLAEDCCFNAPIFVNYPVHRTVKDVPIKLKARKGFDPFSAYHHCFSNDVDFRSFFEWFLDEAYMEELRQGAPNRQLSAVRNAIYNFLPGFSDLKVTRGRKIRVTVVKGNQRLEISQLSNGEKCTLAMVGDLARRLALANPSLDNPLEGEGIVLIDEIELHLHPALQRDIINRLQSTFPNIQFILSTHSPQVLGEINSAQIFFVTQQEDGEDIHVRSVPTLFGKDSNMILEQFMGAAEKNEEIKSQLEKLFRLIMNDAELDEARELLNHLMDILGCDDPTLIRADMILRRKESLNS
ncbi:AAA family ATPase [Bacillus marasmi]|uniref:AAA family ATPase n=1 Tax=Bacillus marasmi TaxID=1926279 RepID=UPI00164E8EF9|nr:AAA family ATPase [Bacillus marasmi]